MEWAKEELAAALFLREDGVSFTRIADLLGKSKNAVVGKLNRIGANDVKGLPDSSMDERLPPDLMIGGCRYVFGDVRVAWHWCGAPITRGSYCATHERLAYRVVNGRDVEKSSKD
jgi:hypothetical protein